MLKKRTILAALLFILALVSPCLSTTLTLTSNSTIDFAKLENKNLTYSNIYGLDRYTLTILDWKSTYSLIDLGAQLTQSELRNINFYSGKSTHTKFVGSGFEGGCNIIPVPEPESKLAAILLLLTVLITTVIRFKRNN